MQSDKRRAPHILLLLATYNGAAFFDKQMVSLASQTVDASIDIVASDDGSTDATRAQLAKWRNRWSRGEFRIIEGPASGFAANFRHLVLTTAEWFGSGYVAFCDQDDVWYADKLARALDWHISQSTDMPALYCARTRLIDDNGRPIGHSPLFSAAPGFCNALVQSLAGGNTMMLNAAAFHLLRTSLERTPVLMHDWWTYLIVSGAGGAVHYDPVPSLDYRQHESNAVGGGLGLRARIMRAGELLAGRYTRWSETNIAALDRCRDLLTIENLAVLDGFKSIRSDRSTRALAEIRRVGLYRQTAFGNIALVIAAAIGKL